MYPTDTDTILLYIGTDGPSFQKSQMILVWKSESRAYINENLNRHVSTTSKTSLTEKGKVLHSFQCIFVKYKQLTFVRCSIPYVQLPLYIRLIHCRSLFKKIVSFFHQ